MAVHSQFLSLPINNATMQTQLSVLSSTRWCILASIILISGLGGCDLNLPFMKNADSLKAEARHSVEIKNFTEAAATAQKLTEKEPADYEGYFLLAQAKAQVGDKNAALVALEQSIKKGLKDDQQIEKTANLDPIKSMSAYTDLMNSSFPSRKPAQEKPDSTDVSIREADGKQVVRAGDLVVEVPVAK